MLIEPISAYRILVTLPNDLPEELLKELFSWNLLIKSPYGCSYYSGEVDWNYKEPNSYRISDHWNFEAKSAIHCKTLQPVENDTYWTLAQFDGEAQKYNVIKSLPKTTVKIRSTKTFKLIDLLYEYPKVISHWEIDSESLPETIRRIQKDKIDLNFQKKYLQIVKMPV